jgi:hypothetical protein
LFLFEDSERMSTQQFRAEEKATSVWSQLATANLRVVSYICLFTNKATGVLSTLLSLTSWTVVWWFLRELIWVRIGGQFDTSGQRYVRSALFDWKRYSIAWTCVTNAPWKHNNMSTLILYSNWSIDSYCNISAELK